MKKKHDVSLFYSIFPLRMINSTPTGTSKGFVILPLLLRMILLPDEASQKHASADLVQLSRKSVRCALVFTYSTHLTSTFFPSSI